jgi:hypothetical protein
MDKENYLSSLKNFSVLRNKFDQFLLKKGPFLLFIQLIITILIFLFGSENPFGPRYTLRWSEAGFFIFGLLVLALEVYVTRDFFENIPRTFQQLVERKVIKGLNKNGDIAEKLEAFLNNFENRLNSRAPLIMASVLEVAILFAGQRSMLFPIAFLPTNYPILALLINFFTIILPATIAGYAMSVVLWKCIVTGYFVHKFSAIFDLYVIPSHPDKAGGLKPFGDLIFSLALIFIVASLAISVMTLADSINNAVYQFLVNSLSPKPEISPPYYLYTTVFVSKIALGIVILSSVVAFILPLLSTHRRMRSEKIILLLSLTGVCNKIAELERQSQKTTLDYKTRNEIFEEVNSLSKIYERTYKTPVWPFDRDILLKFFTPQVISLLSLLGIVQPIIDAIASIVK